LSGAAIRHGGLIATRLGGYWRGVLIEGPPGAGKSDLAFRALEQGFSLAADDRVDTLAGRLEVRGLQVIGVPALPMAEVALVARCGAVERIPDPQFAGILGVSVPLIHIDPREASAPAKLRRALSHFDEAHKRRI
jgi:serine kinase of HPr protein (carbohydrate metabolism regulator)